MEPTSLVPHLRASRRYFAQAAAGFALTSEMGIAATDTEQNVFGPRPRYSPQIGTLVSEMIWMRGAVLRAVKGLTQDQLDFLLDAKANRIGALLLHLAATERLYLIQSNRNRYISAACYCLIGNLLDKDRKWDEAIQHYRKAIELNPKFGLAYNNWGWVLYEEDKRDEAIKQLRKAIQLDPALDLPYRNWGLVLEAQGKRDEAAKYFKKADELARKRGF